MNRLIASVVCVAALSAAVTRQVRGGELEIIGFSVERQSDGKVFVHGALKNRSSAKSLLGIEYAFTQFDGKIWVGVKGVTKSSDPIKSLAPGDNVGVWAYLANVPDGEQNFGLTARVIANHKVVDIAEDKSFTLKAKEPEKPKKPTLTLIETHAENPANGGLGALSPAECRVYVSGQIYPFAKVRRASEFKTPPRLLGDRPVIVQLWQINAASSDVKLGEQRIVSTEKSGKHVMTFTGSLDGVTYKYVVTYRIDR